MRQRRSSNKKNFRQAPKPRRLQGLPDDEPELPLTPPQLFSTVQTPPPEALVTPSPEPAGPSRPQTDGLNSDFPTSGEFAFDPRQQRPPRPRRIVNSRAPRGGRPPRNVRYPHSPAPLQGDPGSPASTEVNLPLNSEHERPLGEIESVQSDNPPSPDAAPAANAGFPPPGLIPPAQNSDAGAGAIPSPHRPSLIQPEVNGSRENVRGPFNPDAGVVPPAPDGQRPYRSEGQQRHNRYDHNRPPGKRNGRDRPNPRFKPKDNKNFGPRGRYNREQNRFESDNAPSGPGRVAGDFSPEGYPPASYSGAENGAFTPSFSTPLVPLPPGPHLEMDDLQQKSARELRLLAKDYEMENAANFKKHELIFEIVRRNMYRNGSLNSGGILELDSAGFGFLRSPRFNYSECPEDVYVSPSQVRRYNLCRGEMVYGPVRHLKDKERFFALGRVDRIEGQPAEEARLRPNFDALTPMFPNRRIFLEGAGEDVSMRAMDLICPLGFGQRGLIVAPPRTGKTILLQKIANSVMENNPSAHLIMLLIDERPEEVTDMLRTVKGEVLASTFDESPTRHVHVAEMVLERAKRLVEKKVDVVILLDSITRLARAYNTLQPSSGKIMSGGIESSALQKPKRFFGAARNVQEGGSLTIIATALIDTGSRADNVIFEEFKGTGNMEVHLDRALSDQRVFQPSILPNPGPEKKNYSIILMNSPEFMPCAKSWQMKHRSIQ